MKEVNRTVKIEELKVNKHHKELYTTNDIDDLVLSIPVHGLLEKIVVNNNYEIISGYRRYLALKKLGYKTVDIEIKNVTSQNEMATIISYNKQRVKTLSKKLNEAEYLKSIWGQKRGRKSAKNKVININNNKPVNTRGKVAKEIGLSTGQLSKVEYIKRKKPEFIKSIEEGNLTINLAHQALKKEEQKDKQKKIAQTSQALLPRSINNNYYKIINKSSDEKCTHS